MQLVNHFTSQLDSQSPDLVQSEQTWDQRAAEVSRFTVAPNDIALQTVLDNMQLAGSRVLEVSFGGGRHLLEFARFGAEVSGVEISAKMLENTQQKLEQAGVAQRSNQLVQSAWEELDLAELNWQQAFDLVFLYMSPAISSTAMLEKALAASRRYLYLALYSHREDSLLGELQDEFGLERKSVGSKSADDLYNIFNTLYQWGYFPQLQFEERLVTNQFEPEYILQRYASWLWRGDERTDDNCARLLAALQRRAVNNSVSTTSRDIVGHLWLDKSLQVAR